MEEEYSMWTDPDRPPPDEPGAQAVFINRQWQFISFAFGIPLSKRSGTRGAARAEAIAVEGKIERIRKEIRLATPTPLAAIAPEAQKAFNWILSTFLIGKSHDHDNKIPDGFSIYCLDAVANLYILIYPDGLAYKMPVEGYESAVGLATKLAEGLSNSETAGPTFP